MREKERHWQGKRKRDRVKGRKRERECVRERVLVRERAKGERESVCACVSYTVKSFLFLKLQ